MNRDSFARNAVAVYLREMAEVRGYGTAETSRYDPLAKLLKTVGGELKPKVSVVQQLSDIGHGLPDFGFFTEAQIRRGRNRGVAGEKPERGVAEIKPLSANIGELLASEQTKKYLRGYGLVLASNYRQFALVENNDGNPKELPRFTLADSEDDFWEKAKHPVKTAAEFGEQLCEFLRRALLHNAPITTADDVAKHLASYARETLALLKDGDEEAMSPLRKDLESMLSMTFSGEDGDHFFHSTLAQSIYYGLFSAWLQTQDEQFDWKKAVHSANPVMGALFSQITNPGQLGKLNLTAQLDGATAMLNRVQDKDALFGGIDAASAIQHFYEPFVAEYDPELRKAMGVWYTPPEVVQYMVERVDRVLRTELNIPDGLADDNVYVLDPCGGTGAYIAETLRRIHKTCKERYGDTAGGMTKTAAKERIIGFEIMSAPYLVAHWQVETLLKELGAPLGEDERAAVYLTNSLTDWNEPDESKRPPLLAHLLQKERDAADDIKRNKKILVILGNPPYNAFSGTSPKQEEDLVAPYKEGLREKWGIKKFNLDDLYVRFFRMAQNRIVDHGKGLVSFISNHSYIKDSSFVVMRESLLGSFNKIWIDALNGDSRETGKTTPEGAPDPSIFSTPMNREGIRVGTAIGMYLSAPSGKESGVLFRNFWGAKKREELLESLDTEESAEFDSRYETVNPKPWNKLSFRPMSASNDFLQWPSIDELYESMSNGMVEARGGALFDIDRAALEARMRDYFDQSIDWETYKRMGGGLAKDASDMDAQKTREKVFREGKFEPENIADFTMRAFDDGFCYYTDIRPVWNRQRPDLYKQYKLRNSFLVSRPKSSVSNEGTPVFFTRGLCDYGVMGLSRCVPFRLYKEDEKTGKKITTNLSEKAKNYLSDLGCPDPDENLESGEAFWLHALAVCCAPNYQTENADGLRIGWPRIPPPPNAATFTQSAALGAKVRDLMDMQNPMNYKSPQVRALLPLAHFIGDSGDRLLDNSWGHKDSNGKTFPGVGKIEPQTADADYPAVLGAPLKIFFNKEAHWEKVPTRVWNYRIGGFQPLKKWLSYRAAKVLGRPCEDFEINTFAEITRRISILMLMEAELNDNYRAAKD